MMVQEGYVMRRLAFLCATAVTLPTLALAANGRGEGPGSVQPQNTRFGYAAVNAACSLGTANNFGLQQCPQTVLVPVPTSAPNRWLTSPCFFLTDVATTSGNLTTTDTIAFTDGQSISETKLVFNIAVGANYRQSFTTPLYFKSGVVVKGTAASTNNEIITVSGFWANCPR